MKNTRTLAYLSLILNTIIWGAALPIVKPALDIVNPYQYLLLRYSIASIFLLPLLIFLVYKHRPTFKVVITISLLETLVIVVGHSILYLGLSQTSALEASLIGITSPIFITIGGVLILRELIEKHELLGLIIALAGTLIVTLEPFSSGGSTTGSTPGNLMVLCYVLIWTIYNLIGKKAYANISKLLIVSIGLIVSTPIMLLITHQLSGYSNLQTTVISTYQLLISNQSVFFASIYMGILGTIIAIPAYIYGLSKIEASEATLFSYLQPLIFIPLAVFWLGESIKPLVIFGLLLIIIGVIVAEIRLKKRNRK